MVAMRRGVAVAAVLCILAACSASSPPSGGATSRLVGYAAGAIPAVEDSAASDLGALSSLAWESDPGIELMASGGGELARAAGYLTVSATLLAEFAGGATASIAVLDGGGLSRALLVDAGPEHGGPVLVAIRAEPDHLLEISSASGRVVLDAEGTVAEQWDAHSSCRWSHCVGGAMNFLVDLAVWDALYWVLATSCGLATDPDTVWTCEVTCALCIASVLGAGYFLIPTILAAMTDCALDSCRWCYSDDCGSPDVLWSSCTPNLGSFDVEEEWVVMEAIDEYYCADPDEYSYCRTLPSTRFVEGCPYGCDPQGLGGACADPPTCDPAVCQGREPHGEPRCVREGNEWVVRQDFHSRECRPSGPAGSECWGIYSTAIIDRCPEGCASPGRGECGWTLTLRVFEPASGDTVVPCAACRVRIGQTGWRRELTTMIDGTVSIQGVAAGPHFVEYGCGPESLGPHLPSDLILHPDLHVTWVPALAPHHDPDIALANVVAPATDVYVLVGRCG